MRQSDHEYEERSFGDIQRAIDFENSMNDLESQLYYQHLSPKEVAQQVLKATCQFYDADWCGLIQVDLDLNLWTPFWWFNTGATDKTMLLTEEYESAEFLDRVGTNCPQGNSNGRLGRRSDKRSLSCGV